jgi:thiol-disulfide isomerase/thioredoxin
MGAIKPVKITFQMSGWDKQEIFLNISGSEIPIKLDEKGVGSIQLDINKPQYVSLENTRMFLEPGKSLVANIRYLKEDGFRPTGFSGAGAAENNVLNSTDIIFAAAPIFDGIKNTDLDDAVEQFLKLPLLQKFSEPFRAMEAQKFRFQFVTRISRWQAVDEKVWKKALIEDTSYLPTYEYQSFLVGMNNFFAKRINEGDSITRPVLSAVRTFSNTKITDYLIDRYVKEYIENVRIDGTDELASLYYKYVSDPNKKTEFKRYLDLRVGSRKGATCLDFSYPDPDGKIISLADLKGKYVLIDFWATWCGACLYEMPALHQMEERYHKNNIVFLGVSIDEGDERIAKWKIKAKELPGLQVLQTSKDLKKQFAVPYIPRYILLDPQGIIINSNMPRPSDPQFGKVLESLPGF